MSIWVIDARQGSVLHLDFHLCGPKAKSKYFERVAEAATNHFRVIIASGVVCSRGLMAWRGGGGGCLRRGDGTGGGADVSSLLLSSLSPVASSVAGVGEGCPRGLRLRGGGAWGGPGWERGLAVE